MKIIHRNDTLDIGHNRSFIQQVCRAQNRRRPNPISGPMAILFTGCGLLILGVILAINLRYLPGDQPKHGGIPFRTSDSDVTAQPVVEIVTERGTFTK